MNSNLLVIQHIDREGPDLIAEVAIDRGMKIQIFKPGYGDLLPNLSECENTIALVLGGPMGINELHKEELKWLKNELTWLNSWHQQKKPILGICLGAQMLALAAGGSVIPLQVGEPPHPLKEVGVGSIHWVVDSNDEPLLKGLTDSELVLHWHSDKIILPQESKLIGSSLHCPVQVFRIGKHAIGLQCHMEVTNHNLNNWIIEDRNYILNAIGEKGADKLLNSWRKALPKTAKAGRIIFNNIFNELLNV